MNVSVSLWSYVELIRNGMSVVDVIEHMHKNGVQYVELLDVFVKPEERESIKNVIEKLNMKVASYSISNNFVCDDSTRLQQVKMVQDACYVAQFFNTKTIRVFCGDV